MKQRRVEHRILLVDSRIVGGDALIDLLDLFQEDSAADQGNNLSCRHTGGKEEEVKGRDGTKSFGVNNLLLPHDQDLNKHR